MPVNNPDRHQTLQAAMGLRVTSAAVALILAACGSQPTELEDLREMVEAEEELRESLDPCPGPGDMLTESMAANGCMDGDTRVILGIHNCEDGRQLWADDRLWGWVGEPVRESDGDAAADPDYGAAYDECYGVGDEP